MLQGAEITVILNSIIGTILVLIVGFFVMQIILAAISLSTGFDSSKKSYESATKQLTGALKGLGIALIAFFLLNTILRVFGVKTETKFITQFLGDQISNLLGCFRNFENCK